MPLATIIIVWPSAGALATASAPMLPPAPGLFSITTGWPSERAICSPSVRAMVSIAPAGGNGTTQRIARDG